MSFHMHLRAIRETEIQDDYSWLEEFMEAAWSDRWEAERDAGIAQPSKRTSALSTSSTPRRDIRRRTTPNRGSVNCRSTEADLSYHPSHDQLPFVLLTAAEVGEAADFLTTASFDALSGGRGRPRSLRPYRGWDEAEVKDIFLGMHAGLGSSTDALLQPAMPVIKAFWY